VRIGHPEGSRPPVDGDGGPASSLKAPLVHRRDLLNRFEVLPDGSWSRGAKIDRVEARCPRIRARPPHWLRNPARFPCVSVSVNTQTGYPAPIAREQRSPRACVAVDHAIGLRFAGPAAINTGVPPSVRLLRPSDVEALCGFWWRLSSETRYRRFMIPLRVFEGANLNRFLESDHDNHIAIAALVQGEIIGIAEYARNIESPSRAEVTIVVADAWQHQGVGIRLLLALADRASQSGIVSFDFDILADNTAALGLLRRLRPTMRLAVAAGILRVSVSISGNNDIESDSRR
jgi:GNAT superfamily N-acetyltransferase